MFQFAEHTREETPITGSGWLVAATGYSKWNKALEFIWLIGQPTEEKEMAAAMEITHSFGGCDRIDDAMEAEPSSVRVCVINLDG